MAIRSTDSLLWSCAPDAPALSRCHLAVHKPTRIDWLCWNGIVLLLLLLLLPYAPLIDRGSKCVLRGLDGGGGWVGGVGG